VALYGGYFGAGIGILMIGALTFISPGEIRHVVALKNFLNCWMRGVAVFVLVLDGNVDWKYGAPMAVRGLVGGYIGGIVSHRANRTVVRSIVIVIGLTVAAYYFWKLYNPAVMHVGGNSEVRGNFRSLPSIPKFSIRREPAAWPKSKPLFVKGVQLCMKTLTVAMAAFLLLFSVVASRGANLDRISAATGVPVETLQAERASTTSSHCISRGKAGEKLRTIMV